MCVVPAGCSALITSWFHPVTGISQWCAMVTGIVPSELDELSPLSNCALPETRFHARIFHWRGWRF